MSVRKLLLAACFMAFSPSLGAEPNGENHENNCEVEQPCCPPVKCCPKPCDSRGHGRDHDYGHEHVDFHPYDYHGHSSGHYYQVGGKHRGKSGYYKGRRQHPGHYHYDRFGDHAHPDADLYRTKQGSWSKSLQGDVHHWESDNFHEYYGVPERRPGRDRGDHHADCPPPSCGQKCKTPCREHQRPHQHDYRTGHRVPLKAGSWPTHWPGQPKHSHGYEPYPSHRHGYPQPPSHGHEGYHHQGPGSYRSDLPYNDDRLDRRNIFVNVDHDEHSPVHPVHRAQDLIQAFKVIKERHPEAPLFALVDGQSLDGIVHMEPVGDGTLILMTVERYGRIERLAIPVEEIQDFGMRSYPQSGSRVQVPESW